MLRQTLLYLSTARWARGIVTHWGLARRVALRFVAGETMDDALRVTRALNDKGLLVTLDYLGEGIAKAEDTRDVVNTYVAALGHIQVHRLRASVSLKLTHLGLDIGEELCLNNLREILTAARARDITWISLDPLVPLGPDGRDSVQGLAVPDVVLNHHGEGVFAVLGAWRVGRDDGAVLARSHPSGGWIDWLAP